MAKAKRVEGGSRRVVRDIKKHSEPVGFDLRKIPPDWELTHKEAIDSETETQQRPVQYPEGWMGLTGKQTGPGFYGDGTGSS